MNEQRIRDILSGRRGGGGAALLRCGLWLASGPYAAAMRVRRWAYRRGVLPSHRAEVPVICVGNLTTGGTGKTPMAVWVVERLKQAGRRPAVLTRGYRADAAAGGSDEAALLRRLTGVEVVVDGDRVAGAAKAVASGADVLVMDDGYQHRRLRRDVDIVLIDAAEPFGYGHCLPRGLLREPPAALADADAVVITHSNEVSPERLGPLRRHIAELAPRASVHAAAHRPTFLIDDRGAERPLDALAGRTVLAFCGLGAPGHFFAAVRSLGAEVVAERALADHAAYTRELLADLAAEAEAAGAEAMVTTQKDYVKIAAAGAAGAAGRVWQLAVTMELVEGAEQLGRKLAAVCAEAEATRRGLRPPPDAEC